MNVAIVRGRLSSAPRVNELASGTVLVRYEVTVPREGGPAESVPLTWTPTGRQVAGATRFGAGDEVVAVGRVRRRWYRPAGGPPRSVTELVADTVVPAGDRRRVAGALRAAGRVLDDGGG